MIRWVTFLFTLVAAAGTILETVQGQERDRGKPVSFAILEDYDKGDDLRDVEADFKAFQSLEIRTWRGSLGWDDFEPERGQYDFEWLHEFATLAEEYRIELRPYVAYTPEWAARPGGADADVWNNPPARLADWEAFTGALAAALSQHPNVASFEIYNEQNALQWWDGTPAEYAEVLTAASRTIRARAPRTLLLFGGLTFPDLEWLEPVCEIPQAARAFDVLPIHAYPETWTPDGVTVENYFGDLEGFASAVDDACGPKRIWINETGFATVPGRTELEQAAWWVRAVATFLAHPRVEHIGVYEIKDLPLDQPAIGDAPNYHLGLMRTDRTEKMAFGTIDMVTDLLDTGTIQVDSGDMRVKVTQGNAGGLHHHLFTRPDGDKVLIVWDTAASPTLSIEVPGIGRSIEYDIDGRPIDWDDTASVLSTLELDAGVPRVFKLLAVLG